MSDVFISYSRLDKEFVGKLREALTNNAQDVWIDWEDIPPSQSWWSEIQKGIARANNFVLVMSPNSLSSPICHMEIEYARQLKKRIIPVLHADYTRQACLENITKRLDTTQETTTREIWGERLPGDVFDANDSDLRHINYFFFKEDADFKTRFEELFAIIRTDYEHKEQHTTLLLRAREWDRRGRDASFLLLDTELTQAKAWLNASSSKEPPPTDLHRAYIQASEQRNRQLNNIRRASIIGSVVAVLALLFAMGASWIGLQARSTANIASTEIAYANQQLVTATRISQQALQAEVTIVAVNTQVAYANEQLATATRISEQAFRAEAALDEASTQVAVVLVTVTEAAVVQDITWRSYEAHLQSDSPLKQIELGNEIVALYPDRSIAYHERGLIYVQYEDYDRALADFNEALRLDPQAAITYYNRGMLYQLQQDYDRALADYEEAIRLDPDLLEAYNNRAIIYEEQGEHDKALDNYNEALLKNPDFVDAWINRGHAYFMMEEYDLAMADFNEAIRLDPEEAIAYFNRGRLFTEQEDYDQAIADYSEAIRLDPDDLASYHNRAYTYYLLDEIDLALADYTEIIRLDPEEWAFYYERGSIYYSIGEYENAVADFNEAISLYPENDELYNERAYAYFDMGDLENALADVTTAIELAPDNPNYYDSRCEFYLKSQQWDAGLADCEMALSLGQEFREEMEILIAEARQNVATPTASGSS